jgi:hypothetical protein
VNWWLSFAQDVGWGLLLGALLVGVYLLSVAITDETEDTDA